MKKPVFRYRNALFVTSCILTVPILIDICTAFTLFSFWVASFLFSLVVLLNAIRIVHGFIQKCYAFSFGLIAQLLAGFLILSLYQLSVSGKIETPFSHPQTPVIVKIAEPAIDSLSVDGKKNLKTETKFVHKTNNN